MSWPQLIGALALGVIGDVTPPAPVAPAPKEAKTTAEIVQWAEKATRGNDFVSVMEFRRGDRRVVFVWYNPCSGFAVCHVLGYTYDFQKERWGRYFDRVFDGTPTVSVEVGIISLVIRDFKGKVLFREEAPD
ncbi:MAG: hypothetical protein NZ700_13255 [Gemmataceae bacterium]|nr:hypothetical protein [Gemmataceae bacterium]MDW8265493.1 hypothetical protein [Gemmataceae bacterium]